MAANHINQHGMKHFARGNLLWLASGGSDVRICLIDEADDTPLDTDEFRSAILAAAIEEDMAAGMTKVDAAVDGVIDGSDVTFLATAGDTCEGVLMYKHDAGGEGSKNLIAYWGSTTAGQGLPVTLGGDVTVVWNASGILKI
ncbi:MAG: hypothetical protein ACRD8U_21265 [Pyrinomonadaceae bacterium]